mmetsp:Transcript_35166/g.100177  ORF Transcript_35166/g.100177 Transcript_35166/m.100177 type:complete len:232 (+) Transcript_35166:706-1401(+)
MLKTRRMLRKCWGGQSIGCSLKWENGLPHSSGRGEAPLFGCKSRGSSPTGQNQVEMCPSTGSHSAAKVPPPLRLNPAPKDPSGPRCEQPWFANSSGASTSQMFAAFLSEPPSQWPPKSSPSIIASWVHDGAVCNVVRVCDCWCTPSMMSNSPQVGQLCRESSPYIQKAGHVAHPVGAWLRRKTNKPALYAFRDWMRMDLLPSPTGMVSTASTDMYTSASDARSIPLASASS